MISLLFAWILNIVACFSINRIEWLQIKLSLPVLCYLKYTMATFVCVMIVGLLSFASNIVVIIGCSVIACKTNNADLKRLAIAPTLATSVIYLTCHLAPLLALLVDIEIMYFLGEAGIPIVYLFIQATWFIFSLTWLITWKKSGVSCFKCCPCFQGRSDEEFQLVETEA